jgi:hypothetical protein
MRLTVEDKRILKELPDDERIVDEYKRLREIYAKVTGGRLRLVLKLITRAAFMSAALSDLEDYLATHGYTETYQNGANQSGKKKSSEVEVYNTMVKNYSAIIRQLSDLLPAETEQKDDGFNDFVNGRDD